MANVKLTERADGSIYLQCRCGEIGQPCGYQGEITTAPPGITLLRQAKREAYEHCWHAHRVSAMGLSVEVISHRSPSEIKAASGLFLVTTEPIKEEEVAEVEEKKA
jgi:hypothetical protein